MSKWTFEIWQQVLGVLAFLIAVLSVFASLGLLLSRMIWTRIRTGRRLVLTVADKVVLALAVVGVICVLYGYFVEPYWLSVETVHLTSAKIRTGKRPIRIVQISDLHCDPQPRLEEKLPGVIAALKPDVIAFTGDCINSPGGLPIFRNCLSSLSKIAPTLVVKGNWDCWYFKDLDRFGNTGATELNGNTVRLNIGGNDIWFGGLPIDTKVTVADAMRGVPENAYRVFLFHYPDFIEEMARNKIDLCLVGHTHGGQVALPFYGAIVTMAGTGKRFERGLYRSGTTYMYVNRGIGMEGGVAPRVRFCARPEVTLIEVGGNEGAVAK